MTEFVRTVSVNVVTKHMKWTVRGEDAEAGSSRQVCSRVRLDTTQPIMKARWHALARVLSLLLSVKKREKKV